MHVPASQNDPPNIKCSLDDANAAPDVEDTDEPKTTDSKNDKEVGAETRKRKAGRPRKEGPQVS